MKENIYSTVTNRLIELLEKGIVPWKSPYFSKTGMPRNFSTGKPYRGMNVFLLGSQRFTSPWFLTYIQAKELGGQVRKGEKGNLVVKYGTYLKSEENGASEEEKCGYLKAYTVFHSTQIDGIVFPEPENLPEIPSTILCDRAREIVEGMPNRPEIKEGDAIPCYRPSSDCVSMPERNFFISEEAYYSTLFHELAHATGHESRLGRKSLMENRGIHAGGDARRIYAEEELVAEMGASFLNAHAGISETEIENSAAYLQGWIKALQTKDAKNWIIKAASGAQKAADFILKHEPQ